MTNENKCCKCCYAGSFWRGEQAYCRRHECLCHTAQTEKGGWESEFDDLFNNTDDDGRDNNTREDYLAFIHKVEAEAVARGREEGRKQGVDDISR